MDADLLFVLYLTRPVPSRPVQELLRKQREELLESSQAQILQTKDTMLKVCAVMAVSGGCGVDPIYP